MAKASASFGHLRKRVWDNRGLKIDTKCAVYRAVVLSALLYGCETWTAYRRHTKLLEQFHQRCLRSILKIDWFHRISNVQVLQQAALSGIEAILSLSQLRWAGHLIRMEDSRLPKQLFYCELSEGKRGIGRPKLRYKDKLKENLKNADVDTENWEELALNRASWRTTINKNIRKFEKANQQAREDKRAAAKEKPPTTSSTTTVTCSVCNRLCASQFGLRSHMRVHK